MSREVLSKQHRAFAPAGGLLVVRLYHRRPTTMSTQAPIDRIRTPAPATPQPGPAPTAIEVTDLKKAFRIPTQRVDTLKERATSAFSRREHRLLEALRGVSFTVAQGEFFGIVGRNGSGKSTLLKLLASIYRSDAGTIRIAGRVAPCIELGVGFNPELTAYDNVVLNGVMMGLTPAEARERYEAVIDFAGLSAFTDVKLKNYSSGMLVRLGFSLMTQVNGDVLLIDEVLAVGDAAFQQKCFDAFARLHAEGKTIILVTHDMTAVEAHCDRAIILEDGLIDRAGDPAEVARRYFALNFPDDRHVVVPEDVGIEDEGARIRVVELVLRDERGNYSASFEQRERIEIEVILEALEPLESALVGFQIVNADGLLVSAPPPLPLSDGRPLEPGERIRVRAHLGNPLAAGHYFLNCAISQGIEERRPVAFRKNAADFVVFGTRQFAGLVELDYEAKIIDDGAE
jgi:ABC-2 type transport system ATP-binding protein